LSSNLVFDGSAPFLKPLTTTSPLTEYGREKATAEKQLLVFGKSVTILRSTKVFGGRMPLFMKWIENLRNKKTIHPFYDKKVSPIPLYFIIKTLYKLSTKKIPGIIQISGEKDITYADIAYRIGKKLGVNSALIQPVKSTIKGDSSYLYTTLETSMVLINNKIKPPKVWDCVDWMIKTCLKEI